MNVRDTSARTWAGAQLKPLLPARWQLAEGDHALPDSDRVRVRVAVQSIQHSDVGWTEEHLVTVRVTVTVPTDTWEVAEARLDDEMDLFLFALDKTDMPWTTAEKGVFEDENNRMGYKFDIPGIRTKPTEETE